MGMGGRRKSRAKIILQINHHDQTKEELGKRRRLKLSNAVPKKGRGKEKHNGN